MSAPVLYLSTDASAPTLTGQVGSLVALLDAILVNGYGAKSAAGWTKSFSGTNQASYRMAAGNQFYLDVDDRGASGILTGATPKEAAIRGYETMSALSTGTGAFPTTAQIAAATANWRKSATADATARAWGAVADDRTLVIWFFDGDVASSAKMHYFGDFYSLKNGDSYRVAIKVRNNQNSVLTSGTLGDAWNQSAQSATTGQYAPRGVAGTGTSIQLGSGAHLSTADNQTGAQCSDGTVLLDRYAIYEISLSILRGWWRGIYPIFGNAGVANGDTFGGKSEIAGRSFYVVKAYSGGSNAAIAIETSNTWDTSS